MFQEYTELRMSLAASMNVPLLPSNAYTLRGGDAFSLESLSLLLSSRGVQLPPYSLIFGGVPKSVHQSGSTELWVPIVTPRCE